MRQENWARTLTYKVKKRLNLIRGATRSNHVCAELRFSLEVIHAILLATMNILCPLANRTSSTIYSDHYLRTNFQEQKKRSRARMGGLTVANHPLESVPSHPQTLCPRVPS